MSGNIVGVFIFAVLAVVRLDQALHGSWIAALLALQAGVAVLLYFWRNVPGKTANKRTQALTWLSALLPLAFSPSIPKVTWFSLLPIPGLLLALWAMISLNRSFSIAPADRGLVQQGPYKLIRHPMYAGEILSLAGVLMAAFSFWNVAVFVAFIISVVWRVYEEESLIRDYEIYLSEVDWRLLWKIW